MSIYLSSRSNFVGDYYASVERFAELLNINAYKEDILNKIVLYIDDSQVTLTVNNPFIKIDNTLYQLPLDIKEFNSEIYFPIRETMAVFNRHLSGDYVYDQDQRSLEIYFGAALNITGLTVDEKANGTLVRIKTTKQFGKNLNEWFDDNEMQPHLTVEFYKGKLDTLQMSSAETRGLVLRNTAVQSPEIAQITFILSHYVESYDVIENPGEILISLTRKSTFADTLTLPAQYLVPVSLGGVDVSELVAKDRESWKINTVVIDPGHGGRDPGTISSDGLKEKDIVLDIAKDLGKLLQNSNVVENVIFTRNSDIYVPLLERAEIANSLGGKLFVSIHVNSNNNTRLRGFETYFLRPGKNQDALEVLEVVQRENNVMNLFENKDPDRELSVEDRMVLSITQSAFVKESEQLAVFISEGIDRKVSWPNRGVKQAGFVVLWGVSMPNVLVEVGFISNASQRNDMRISAFKHRVAEGIFEGIKKFIEEVRRN